MMSVRHAVANIGTPDSDVAIYSAANLYMSAFMSQVTKSTIPGKNSTHSTDALKGGLPLLCLGRKSLTIS